MSDIIAVPDYGWKSTKAGGSSRYLYGPILRMVQKSQPRSILDLGCGNGHLATLLTGEGRRVVAIDADAKGIAMAKAATPSIDYRCINVGQEPPRDFLESPFDLIISTEVIEHMFFPGQLFDFAGKSLQVGGRFFVSTPYHGRLKNTAIGLMGRWDEHHQPGHIGGHIKFWSRRTLGELARLSGFEEMTFIGCGRCPYLWKSMLIGYTKTG
jgi:SAM-dependent methyltransferase